MRSAACGEEKRANGDLVDGSGLLKCLLSRQNVRMWATFI
jgi:hypothetical protein